MTRNKLWTKEVTFIYGYRGRVLMAKEDWKEMDLAENRDHIFNHRQERERELFRGIKP